MRKLNHRTLRNTALRAIEDLQWIAEHAAAIAERANDDVDDALTGRSYDTVIRHTNELTGPERRGEHRAHHPDQVHEHMTRLVGTLGLARDAAGAARDEAGKLTVSADPRDRAAAARNALATGKAGSGACLNCNTYVPGIATDRLRAGRCWACYAYRRDHYGNERPTGGVVPGDQPAARESAQ